MKLRDIAERILELVSFDKQGERWGFDTNCGGNEEVIDDAVEILRTSLSDLEFMNELTVSTLNFTGFAISSQFSPNEPVIVNNLPKEKP